MAQVAQVAPSNSIFGALYGTSGSVGLVPLGGTLMPPDRCLRGLKYKEKKVKVDYFDIDIYAN